MHFVDLSNFSLSLFEVVLTGRCCSDSGLVGLRVRFAALLTGLNSLVVFIATARPKAVPLYVPICFCRSYMLNLRLRLVCPVLLFVCFVSTYLLRYFLFFTFSFPSARSSTFVQFPFLFHCLSLPIFKYIPFPTRGCPITFP